MSTRLHFESLLSIVHQGHYHTSMKTNLYELSYDRFVTYLHQPPVSAVQPHYTQKFPQQPSYQMKKIKRALNDKLETRMEGIE